MPTIKKKILEASRCYDEQSNYRGWCEMMEEILRILRQFSLNGRGDWSHRDRNRVQDDGVTILQKIDACALKLIKETVELTWDSPIANAFQQIDGVFAIKDTVDQLKRLVIKCKKCSLFLNDDKELNMFSRALRLVDSV